MTDNAPERIWANPDRWIDRPPSPHCFRPFEYVEYIRADLYTAVCEECNALDEACITWSEVSQRNYQRAKAAEAERDALKARNRHLSGEYDVVLAGRADEYDRAEAAEAAIQAALERLDASLFTNAEHQQAKDILRAALQEKPHD